MANDALNLPSAQAATPSTNGTNGTNGDHAVLSNTGQAPDATTTAQGQPPDAGTLFYQLSAITLLAATWAALIREDRNAEADNVERIGRGAYGTEAFQLEMDRAVENA